MGSSSGSCALSGLSLGEGDECYALLLSTEYVPRGFGDDSIFSFALPPMRGTYDGYGGIALTESVRLSNLSLDAGDNWPEEPIDSTSGTGVALISARVFEVLPALTGDYGNHGTIGAKTKAEFDCVRSNIAQARSFEPSGVEDFSTQEMRAMKAMHRLGQFIDVKAWPAGPTEIGDRIEAESDVEDILELYARCIVLHRAQVALRKLIVPGITGAQWPDDDALRQFHEVVGGELDRRASVDAGLAT